MKLPLFVILCIPLVFTDFTWPNAPTSPLDDDDDDGDDINNSTNGNNTDASNNTTNGNSGNNGNSDNPNAFSWTPSHPVVRNPNTGVGWCFPLGICRLQSALSDHSIIALESSLMPDLFLSAVDNGCNTMTNGPCGTVYGYLTPYLQQNRTEAFIKKNVNLQWEVTQKSVDYFCIRSVRYNAYLYLSGQDCQGALSQECGMIKLYKSDKCQKSFGWDVTFISNYYVLRSVQFPDVFLYFNSTGCTSGHDYPMGCGKVVGHYFKNINDALSSTLYQGAFWNVPYQRAPMRSHLRRG
jgi:hypothetical protein